MRLKSERLDAVELDNEVFKKLLNFYPEEKLMEHEVFKNAFNVSSITYNELKSISEKIHLPWQMFLLDMDNLKRELENIEKNRLDKFPKELLQIHKRKSAGEVTSKRIIDRQIRTQSFVVSQLPENFVCDFSGSLKGKDMQNCVNNIISYFHIDLNYFRSRESGEKAKEYLIQQIHLKGNINISQGVRKNGILPEVKNTSTLYKNTSGFVVKDKKIPFIFLPSELNPNENHFRQIYTLMYLIVIIGMEEYSHAIENYSIQKIRDDKKFKLINDVVSEILLPTSITNSLGFNSIDRDMVNKLKDEYKISYTAILFVLRIRKKIDKEYYESLKLPEREISVFIEIKKWFNQPHIITSVRKFCGDVAFEKVNNAIKNNSIYPNQAQMIIFGRFRKDKWSDYRSKI
ncbi:MAG: hypothetical protein QG566_587 [Patescibacteria group bacterium]|nr:hypothetical protein [Patescibacteria group bacterium]